MATSSLWQRFQQYFLRYDELGFSIDISRMKFGDEFFSDMRPKIDKAFAAMHELEAGAIANPDEDRMVGHYWLRNPALAPNSEIRAEEPLARTVSDVGLGRRPHFRNECGRPAAGGVAGIQDRQSARRRGRDGRAHAGTRCRAERRHASRAHVALCWEWQRRKRHG